MILLKQSTAATLRVGPFMDATNGVTPETGITLGAADQAEALKATGATVDISGATWAAITGVGGWYDLSLTTTHTDTLGMLTIIVQDESVCLPVFTRAMVVPANVYDSLVAGSDVLDVSTVQWLGTACATPATAGHPVVTHKVGTGTGEMSLTSGVASANVTQFGGSAGTFAGGIPAVNTTQLAGTAQTGRDIGASVLLSSGTGTGQVSLSGGAVKIQTGLKKAQALSNFPFLMTDSTNHNPLTGLTVTATRSLDGAAFSAGTIANMTEVSNGIYQCDLLTGDMNGDTIVLRFTASGADDLFVTLVTEP